MGAPSSFGRGTGQLICATNGLGGKTRYTYTLDGQVASVTDPTGAVSTFTYDVAGQLVSSRDALGRVTTARYDKAGRLVGTTSPDGDRLEYTYDGAGMLATTRFNAQLLSRVERDAVSRGFLSVDPVVSPAGAGWGANVYCFVGNAPSALVDPWGASPMTVAQFREYRGDVFGRVVGRLGKGLESWANEHAGAIAAVAIAAGTVFTVAALVATGPVGLIVAGAAGGALLSGGLSILTNRGADGRVDWKKVGLDTLLGGLAGGAGGLLVKGIGAVRGVAHLTKGLNATTEGFSKSMQGLSVLDDAAVAGTRSVQFAQKAASSARYNPMRYVNSWRSGQFGRQAESLAVQGNKLISQDDELLSVANTHLRKYEYFADFANQKAGKVLSSGLSGGIPI